MKNTQSGKAFLGLSLAHGLRAKYVCLGEPNRLHEEVGAGHSNSRNHRDQARRAGRKLVRESKAAPCAGGQS